MSNEPTRNDFLAGDFISERAVRGVFGRRGRRTPPSTPTEPQNVLPASPPRASRDPSPPTAGPRPLRRWSVAELIARAVATPPRTA
jgi:hypothetical protein